MVPLQTTLQKVAAGASCAFAGWRHHNSQIVAACAILERAMGSCENCAKLSLSLIEFNSVLLCPACFDKEIQRLSATIIEP